MTSKELLERLLNEVEQFMGAGGSMGDALGALKMVKMSLEASFAAHARGITEEKDDAND